MTTSLGVNFFQKANEALKPRVRAFYNEILGCELQEIDATLDIFHFPNEATYGIRYVAEDNSYLSEADYRRSTWMSLKSSDRAHLIARIKEFGVHEFPDMSDENNFFFQAPGGQVYAL